MSAPDMPRGPAPAVAVIGTGRMGTALARALPAAVGPILWASRDPDALAARIAAEGIRARAVSTEEAVERADWVIPTLWFRDVIPWLDRFRPALAGKLLIDITNPFSDDFESFTTAPDTSAAEEIQRRVPDTRVVAAFKNTFSAVFDTPGEGAGRSDVMVASDDAAARQRVVRVLEPLPFRFLDAGVLANSRTIERMTLLARELALREGHHPLISWRLWGGPSARH